MATEGWQPQMAGLQEIVQQLMLFNSPDNAQHAQVLEVLKKFNENPEYNMYLTYIFIQLADVDITVRQMAGLLLKNNIKAGFQQMPPQTQAYIKSGVIAGLGSSENLLRNTAGSCITTLFAGAMCSQQAVTELLPPILQSLSSPDSAVVLGAFAALHKICEDNADLLNTDTSMGRPLNSIIPSLLGFFQHPVPACREYAVGCMNQFIMLDCAALQVSMSGYVEGLSALAQDTSSVVRQRVCQAMNLLLEFHPDAVMPRLGAVIQFMLQASQDGDQGVALDAVEFWSTLCECEEPIHELLQQQLPRLVPLLLHNMKYSAEDLETLVEDETLSSSVPDRAEDVKPIFHKPKEGGGGGEDDDDDEDGGDDLSAWNVRKCSAAALDALSLRFGPGLLPCYLPALNDLLQSAEWPVVESGILSLGAVAEGCVDGLAPHLPQLLPFLLQQLNSGAYLIRSITSWTLSRYSNYAVHMHVQQQQQEQQQQQQPQITLLQQMMEGLLLRVRDGNKKVQEAACSAFATLEQEAGSLLVPHLVPIMTQLVAAFAHSQQRNLLILYDAIGTLADAVQSELNQPQVVSLLMPALIAKYQQLQDGNRELFPLFECLTSVAQALGIGFQEYAAPVWSRCISLVEQVLLAQQQQQEEAEEEFAVCSLDLMSGIAEGLGGAVDALVRSTTTLPLLARCMQHPSPDVRQSSFALAGDLSKALPPDLFLLPAFQQQQQQGGGVGGEASMCPLMVALLGGLDPNYQSMCNNACWCIGEVSVKVGPVVAPYIPLLHQRLLPLLSEVHGPAQQENAAITVGRLGLAVPEAMAPLLPELAGPWCRALRYVRVEAERVHAYTGLAQLAQLNPRGIQQDFVAFCEAVVCWEEQPVELTQQFAAIMNGFKAGLEATQWAQFCAAAFNAPLREQLARRFGLQ